MGTKHTKLPVEAISKAYNNYILNNSAIMWNNLDFLKKYPRLCVHLKCDIEFNEACLNKWFFKRYCLINECDNHSWELLINLFWILTQLFLGPKTNYRTISLCE